MSHMGNGAYGQCGDRGQWGTGDMGHMGNEAHRGYGVQGMGYMLNSGTGGIEYKGYGPHGQ